MTIHAVFYKGCFLETSQIFKKIKGWRLLLKGMQEKMKNKEFLFFLILYFSLLKLRGETVNSDNCGAVTIC